MWCVVVRCQDYCDGGQGRMEGGWEGGGVYIFFGYRILAVDMAVAVSDVRRTGPQDYRCQLGID